MKHHHNVHQKERKALKSYINQYNAKKTRVRITRIYFKITGKIPIKLREYTGIKYTRLSRRF